MSSAYTSFYHYTSEEGLQRIIDSGRVRQSSHHSNHAHFGRGAYGTSLPPSAGQRLIAENNWESYADIYVSKGKAVRAIEVQIPYDRVFRADCDGRDILVHNGPIYLNDYNWRTWTVPVDSDKSDRGNYDARERNGHDNGKRHNYSGPRNSGRSDCGYYDVRGGNCHNSGMRQNYSGSSDCGYYDARGANRHCNGMRQSYSGSSNCGYYDASGGNCHNDGMHYSFNDPFNSGYWNSRYDARGGHHYYYDGY